MQAKADMAWIADGVSLPEWRPVSPVTGRLGVCRWKTPAKRPQHLVHEHSGAAWQPAGRDIRPQALVIDAAAGGTARQPAGKATSSTGAAAFWTPNVDIEPSPSSNDEVSLPLTRIVVDDPGISEEPEEEDAIRNEFRLF